MFSSESSMTETTFNCIDEWELSMRKTSLTLKWWTQTRQVCPSSPAWPVRALLLFIPLEGPKKCHGTWNGCVVILSSCCSKMLSITVTSLFNASRKGREKEMKKKRIILWGHISHLEWNSVALSLSFCGLHHQWPSKEKEDFILQYSTAFPE